jgi:hypothetical protein
MAFNVNDFRGQLVGDGARPNLFDVQMAFPAITNPGFAVAAGPKVQFMAKAAQLPGSTIGTVPLYYFGREMKFAGNRTFTDWTLTIINDEDFTIRNALESWMNSINSHAGNLRNSSGVTPTSYATDAVVTQYGKVGSSSILKQYNFVGMFPVDIAPIDLDWSTNDAIEEYSVTFSYQYWTSTTTS